MSFLTEVVVFRMLAETGKVEMANALFHTQAVDGLVKEEDGLVKEETTKKSQIAPRIGGKGNSTKKSKDKHKQSKW